MFCPKCGLVLVPGATACPRCGTPAEMTPGTPPPQGEVSQAPTQPIMTPPPHGGQAGSGSPWSPPPSGWSGNPPTPPPHGGPVSHGEPPKKKGPSPLMLGLILGVAALLLAGGVFAWFYLRDKGYEEDISIAAQSLDSGDYQAAARAYQSALDRRSGDADATLGLAQAYLGQDRSQDALALLEGLTLEDGDSRAPLLATLTALCRLDGVDQVVSDAFPRITLALPWEEGAPVPDAAALQVEEGNETRDVESVELQGGRLLVTYLAEDTELSGQDRQVTCSLQAQGLTRTLEAGYTTPVFDPATLTLVSTDVSEYPTVRAYFRVTNAATGESLSGLDRQSFTVEERLSGGTYLSREVHDATLLEEKEGLNIDLVADKSDSISESDMQKVKNVMIQFVSSLQFVNGDQAEVLAFDTIVQQMCCYTDNVDLLINGINNMSTDGLTAFYDAVYDAVTYTALQGGARCVVAFTDGMDNSSIRSSQQLIQYAQAKQVPVYIIGVGGGVEEGTLRTIAQSTGGRYWYIDDLYDLESIFNSIYTEQKDLYVVEYESDPSADPFSPRSLSVSVSGGGCRGSQDVSFTPVPTAASNSGGERYVLVEEALSWQEASQRCQEMGGHLATITSQEEMDTITRMADAAGIRYLWLGGYTSYDSAGHVFGHWVTGESFTFQAWGDGEPSRVDQDGTDEWYIMLWNIESLGGWNWNDQRNDPVAVVPSMGDAMGFVCEFES